MYMFTSIANLRNTIHAIHLLQALPIIHFLRKESAPNETKLMTLKDIRFDDSTLNFSAIHQAMDHYKEGYEEYLITCISLSCLGSTVI